MPGKLEQIRMAVRSSATPYRIDDALLAMGSIECRLQRMAPPASLVDAEFKVFSQFGEDGAIQYLINRLEIPSETFVEIGVESYREANTRFLALHDNWSGLVLDGDSDHVEFITETDLAWKVDLTPVQAFVTRDNINQLLESHGFAGEIGLLSIDVDGMDYWLLEAIEVARPAILVMEYQSIFGSERAVTVPYTADFVARESHWSGQYHGASLKALTRLGEARGYVLVGATSNAVNCFFVREDLVGDLPRPTVEEAWRPSRFLTSRDESGTLLRLRDHRDRLRLIRDLDLIDVETDEVRTVGEIYGV